MKTPEQQSHEIDTMKRDIARLEQLVRVMSSRIVSLEQEVKRVRGASRRAMEHVGAVERRIPR